MRFLWKVYVLAAGKEREDCNSIIPSQDFPKSFLIKSSKAAI